MVRCFSLPWASYSCLYPVLYLWSFVMALSFTYFCFFFRFFSSCPICHDFYFYVSFSTIHRSKICTPPSCVAFSRLLRLGFSAPLMHLSHGSLLPHTVIYCKLPGHPPRIFFFFLSRLRFSSLPLTSVFLPLFRGGFIKSCSDTLRTLTRLFLTGFFFHCLFSDFFLFL